MSNTQEHWDDDIDWLYSQLSQIGKRPTADQEEHFAERVAIMVADGAATVAEARRRVLHGLFG